MNPVDMWVMGVSAAESINSMRPAAAKVPAHISICVCTYKRPSLLKRLLIELNKQETGGLFTYSIVVADNDEARSAEVTIAEMRAVCAVPIMYCVEPRRNIALARNKVMDYAEGEYVALIDDDEFPTPTWLLTLFKNCDQYQVDGVLGPVKRHFDEVPPAWFQKSKIYDRRVNQTGKLVDWREARTGNVLLKRRVFAGEEAPFRPEFRAGEDQDFFRRKTEEGRVFVWSADAVVFETIPPARWKRRYILRKALLQGATAALQPDCGVLSVVKSLIAVPLYVAILPFAFLCGQQYFVTLMVKICDHSGKLLMLIGVNPVREEYVSE
jgi:glycosyltransferase involved in cell wall biosynthesis